MADIGGLVALRRRRTGLGAPVQHAVQTGSQALVCLHLFADFLSRWHGRHLHQAEVRIQAPLAGMVVLFVAGGTVHHMGERVPLPTDAQRSGAAAVHVERILRMEVLFQETRQFPGRHALAQAFPPAIHRHHEEMAVPGNGHRRTGMPHALVPDRMLVIVLLKLRRRKRAVHKERPHRLIIVDEHGRTGENILPRGRGIKSPLLRNGLALSVKGNFHLLARCVRINGRLALPVEHGRLHHGVPRHAGVVEAAHLGHHGDGLIRCIERSHGIFPPVHAGRYDSLFRPGEPQRVGRVGHVPVQDIDLLGRAGNRVQPGISKILDSLGNGFAGPALSHLCKHGRNQGKCNENRDESPHNELLICSRNGKAAGNGPTRTARHSRSCPPNI